MKYLAPFALPLAAVSANAFAGVSSFYQLTWSGASAVPAASTPVLVALALLMAVIAFRFLAKRPLAARIGAACLAVGLTFAVGGGSRQLEAAPPKVTTIEAEACTGSEVVSNADSQAQDGCGVNFKNACGAPVTIAYREVSEACGDLGFDGGRAEDGRVVNEGEEVLTAFCSLACR